MWKVLILLHTESSDRFVLLSAVWPFRNGGLTYDALGQIDPPSPGIGLEYDLSEQKIQNIWHVYANNSKLISKSKIFYS